MAPVQDAYDGLRPVEAVQRKVAARPVSDHELAQRSLHAAADARMTGEDLDRIGYLGDGLFDGFGRGIKQELDNALQVSKCGGGIDYPRHRTARGRRGLPPRALAAR